MNSERFKKIDNLFNQPAELEQRLREYINAHRMSPIAQYAEVLEYIVVRGDHLTLDDIFQVLSPSDPTLSRSRLYSILDIFTKAGTIQRVNIDRDTVYYEGGTLAHAHFICTSCGRMEDVPLAEGYAQIPIGGVVESVTTVYKGLCRRCVGTHVN